MSERRDEEAADSGAGRLPTITYVITIILIAAYLVALALAWAAIGEAADIWARRVVLLGGLEALAFSAAGAVLGVTVQRPAVKAAEKRARDNERDAKAGQAVVSSLRAKARGADEGRMAAASGTLGADEVMAREYQELLAVAEEAAGR